MLGSVWEIIVSLLVSSHSFYFIFDLDDLWVVSQQMDFPKGGTFLAKSVFYAPIGDEVEIQPITGYSPSNWFNNGK